MNSAVRDSLVTDYDSLSVSISLPDDNDRHVVAAALVARAHTIVTWNIRDFPAETLAAYGLDARTPDEFVSELIDEAGDIVFECVEQIADARLRRPQTVGDVLRQLEIDGLRRSAPTLRKHA